MVGAVGTVDRKREDDTVAVLVVFRLFDNEDAVALWNDLFAGKTNGAKRAKSLITLDFTMHSMVGDNARRLHVDRHRGEHTVAARLDVRLAGNVPRTPRGTKYVLREGYQGKTRLLAQQ